MNLFAKPSNGKTTDILRLDLQEMKVGAGIFLNDFDDLMACYSFSGWLMIASYRLKHMVYGAKF